MRRTRRALCAVPFYGVWYTESMPRNRAIYLGVLIMAATALLYLGGQLIRLIEWFLPWAAGVGVALILIGLYAELQKNRKPKVVASDTDNRSVSTAPKEKP